MFEFYSTFSVDWVSGYRTCGNIETTRNSIALDVSCFAKFLFYYCVILVFISLDDNL